MPSVNGALRWWWNSILPVRKFLRQVWRPGGKPWLCWIFWHDWRLDSWPEMGVPDMYVGGGSLSTHCSRCPARKEFFTRNHGGWYR